MISNVMFLFYSHLSDRTINCGQVWPELTTNMAIRISFVLAHQWRVTNRLTTPAQLHSLCPCLPLHQAHNKCTSNLCDKSGDKFERASIYFVTIYLSIIESLQI